MIGVFTPWSIVSYQNINISAYRLRKYPTDTREARRGVASASGPAYAREICSQESAETQIVMFDWRPAAPWAGETAPFRRNDVFSSFRGELPRAAQHQDERARQNGRANQIINSSRIGPGPVAQEPDCIGADKASEIAERVDQANAGRGRSFGEEGRGKSPEAGQVGVQTHNRH